MESADVPFTHKAAAECLSELSRGRDGHSAEPVGISNVPMPPVLNGSAAGPDFALLTDAAGLPGCP